MKKIVIIRLASFQDPHVFIDELSRLIDSYQNNGGEVEIQYSLSDHDHVYKVGELVRSKMAWNKGHYCVVIDVQPKITMNGAVLVGQRVQLSYSSDDPEDVSGWLSAREIEPFDKYFRFSIEIE